MEHAQPTAPDQTTPTPSAPVEVRPAPVAVPAAAPEGAAPGAAPPPPRDPNAPKPKQFSIKPAIGDKPGYIWVANEDGVGGLGRVYMVKMRFGREVERIRMTKLYKKHSAKQVRDELDPLIGDLLYNEREHGALTEQAVRDVIAKVARKLAGPPRRPGPGRGPGGPRGGGGGYGGPPRGPRPDGAPQQPRDPNAPRDARPDGAPLPTRDPSAPRDPAAPRDPSAPPASAGGAPGAPPAPRVKPPPFDRPGGAPPRAPGANQGDRGPLGPNANRKYTGGSLSPTRAPKPSPNQPPPYEP